VQRATYLPDLQGSRSPASRRATGEVLHCVPDMAAIGAACISKSYSGSSAGIFNPAGPKVSPHS
jgi:hypothetical protein